MKTPDEIKKAFECCMQMHGCKECSYSGERCTVELSKDTLAYIQELEAVVMLMVLQYCQANGKLDHQFMCAGEQAFKVLGLEQYGPIEDLHKLMDESGVI